MKLALIFVYVLMLASCSSKSSRIENHIKKQLLFIDESGQYDLIYDSGKTKKNQFFVRKTLKSKVGDGSVLEKITSLATFGKLGEKLNILRPVRSIYEVWFDKKRYLSDLQLNVKKKSVDVWVLKPGEKAKLEQRMLLQGKNRLYCFYSQLIDCIRVTGFLDEVVSKGLGEAKVSVIWDGYPFFQEQYPGAPKEVVTDGIVVYEGPEENSNETKIVFNYDGDGIIYFLDENLQYKRQYWISHGLSIHPPDHVRGKE